MSCNMTVVCQCPCLLEAIHPTCCIHAQPAEPIKAPQDNTHKYSPLSKSNSSGGSSVYSLRSRLTEASSTVSSLTLVDHETRWEPSTVLRPRTFAKIPEDYSTATGELVPRPLLVRNIGRPSLPQSPPPSYSKLVDKPLPHLPAGATTPVYQSMQFRTSRQNILDTQEMKTHRALPQKPLPYHLSELDQAFNKAGLVSPSSVGPGDSGSRHHQDSVARSQIPVTPTQTPQRRAQLQPKQSPDKNVGLGITNVRFCDGISEKKTDPKPSQRRATQPRRHSHGLVQTIQRFWPSKLFSRPRSRSLPAPTIPPRPPSPFPATLPQQPAMQTQAVRQPQTALERGPPLSPTTRMKRVLSVLMDERVSLDLSNVARTAELDRLLQRTRLMVADGLQPFGYQMQATKSSDPLLGQRMPPSSPVSKHSLYELDGRPLASLAGPLPWVSTLQHVMEKVDSLEELFSLALVNKAAYTAFKTNELGLIKATVWKTSPPAWELRQASEVPWNPETLPGGQSPAATLPGSQSLAASLYFRHYSRDLCYLAGIKFLLEYHCLPLLSEDIIIGLRDPFSIQANEVDAAVWRIWTFCHLFGNRKDREQDIIGQQQWLRGEGSVDLPPVCQTSPDPADFNTVLFTPFEGFAQGNPGGLSQKQLLHMLEIWIAMGTLLDFLRKETRRARRNGLFEGADLDPETSKEEVRMLRDWLGFVLTLGPAAVLELAPLGPSTDPDIAFGRASSNGWTHWTPPSLNAPRSNFLAGVVRSMLRTAPGGESDHDALSPTEVLAEGGWF